MTGAGISSGYSGGGKGVYCPSSAIDSVSSQQNRSSKTKYISFVRKQFLPLLHIENKLVPLLMPLQFFVFSIAPT